MKRKEMKLNELKKKEKRELLCCIPSSGNFTGRIQQVIGARAGEALICARERHSSAPHPSSGFLSLVVVHPFIRTAIWVSRLVLLLRSREELSA